MLCKGDCDEETTNKSGYCRECDIERRLTEMQCKTCNRMRYRRDDATGPIPGLAYYLWGKRCKCRDTV